MYKSCKTEKSAQRQREIEDGFLRLLSQKHFEQTTVSEICLFLDIPRKAFYRYFDSKEGVLKASIDHILISYENYSAASPDSKKRTITSELSKYFEFWKLPQQLLLLSALKKSKLFGHLIQRSIEYSSGKIAGLTKFLKDEDEWVQKQIFQFAVTGLMTMMLDWYNSGFKKSSFEMAQAARRMVASPLFPNLELWGILNE